MPRSSHRRRRVLEALEPRVLMSAVAAEPGPSVDNGTLLVTGTANADAVAIELAPGGDFRVTFNGSAQTFPGVQAIRADLLGGDDALTLGFLNGISANVDGGDGADSMTLVASGVGAFGGVRLLPGEVLDDRRDVRHSGVESLTVLTGEGDDAITVDQGAAGTEVRIESGAGDDAIDVRSGKAMANLPVVAGEGDDVLTFHAGAGPVASFEAGQGDDRFVYAGTDAGDIIIVEESGFRGSGGYAAYGADTETVEVQGLGGSDTLDVNRTRSAGHTVVKAGAGDDTISFGDFTLGAHVFGGRVDIDGQEGHNRIVVNNRFNTGAGVNGYSIDGGAIAFATGGAAFYAGIESVEVFGGESPDSFGIIPAEATAITVHGGSPLASPPPRQHAGDSAFLRLDGAEGMSPAQAQPGDQTFTFTNRRPVTYTGIESAGIISLPVAVTQRNVFYNHSSYDNDLSAADPSDDNAIAPDKQALLPGQALSFANVTSYNKGINGILIDIQDLAPSGLALGPGDFGIKVGTGGDPASWAAGPAPKEVLVRRADGTRADRILLVWAENAIRNQWVQVTVPAGPKTGLASPDTFIFGNLVGETGDASSPFRVSAADLGGVRSVLNQTANINSPFDINRDGRINALDMSLVKQNLNHGIAAPAAAAVPASLVPTLRLGATGEPANRVWVEPEVPVL